MGEWRVPQDWADEWKGLHVAKDYSCEVAEEKEESVALHHKAECCEQKPSDDNHDEACEEDRAANDFTLSREEADRVLRADDHDQAHYEGQVANA